MNDLVVDVVDVDLDLVDGLRHGGHDAGDVASEDVLLQSGEGYEVVGDHFQCSNVEILLCFIELIGKTKSATGQSTTKILRK